MKTFYSSRLRTFLAMIILASATVSSSMAAPVVKDWKTVRIGIDSFNPPFSSIDPDQGPNGFDVAMARTLCERIKARCDFVPAARGALLGDLMARRSDAVIASMAITDERRKTVDFTDKYYTITGRFAVSRTSGIADVSTEKMRGKAIGAAEGSPFATYVTEVYGAKGAIVKLYRTDSEAEADLRAGRLAVVFGSAIRLYRWFDEGTSGQCCRFVGPEIRSPKVLGEGAGIAIRKEDGDLRELFNRAIADILRDGTYEKVNAMYFNFLIY
jgi:polar amino acid transport system substrate-binding protein